MYFTFYLIFVFKLKLNACESTSTGFAAWHSSPRNRRLLLFLVLVLVLFHNSLNFTILFAYMYYMCTHVRERLIYYISGFLIYTFGVYDLPCFLNLCQIVLFSFLDFSQDFQLFFFTRRGYMYWLFHLFFNFFFNMTINIKSCHRYRPRESNQLKPTHWYSMHANSAKWPTNHYGLISC